MFVSTLYRSDLSIKLGLLLLAALASLLISSSFSNLRYLAEEKLGALGWKLFPDQRLEQRITVIAIDEASLEQVGPWPWPRETMARLSDQLADAGAALQVYDVVFPEAKIGDARLVESFSKARAVLGTTPLLDANQWVKTGQMSGALAQLQCQEPMPRANNYVANHPRFSALPAGHLMPLVDSDGMIRQQPALLCVEGQVYPSLALQALLQGFGLSSDQRASLELLPAQSLLDPAWQLKLTNYAGLHFPLDAAGNVRFSYHLSPDAFQVVSAAEVLNGTAPKQLLEDAWVIVGATAFGLGDIVPTPHNGETPGVELQVRMLSALLDGEVPYQPVGAWLAWLLECLLFAAILLLISSRRHRFAAIALPVALFVLPLLAWYLHVSLLAANIWLGWWLPALFASLSASLFSLHEQWKVRLERQRIFANLSSYLPSQVASSVAYAMPSGAIEAERKSLVLLCADLRNFSAYEEARPPEETAALLHCFFVKASEIVEQFGGVVEEFSGDAVLASWGDDNNQQAAYQAYLAAQQLHSQISAIFPTRTPAGLEPLALGIGIEKGPVLVGSIGPSHRRTHTLLGDTVTITLRIQAMTQDLAQPILLGECAARDIPSNELESQGSFLLDDLKTPHVLFALCDGELADDFDDIEEPVREEFALKVINGNKK